MEELKPVIKQIVDFESLKVNRYHMQHFFEFQGCMNYLDMLNELIFPHLVQHFWVLTEVYHEDAVAIKEYQKIPDDEKLKGKYRAEIGLPEFKKVQIISLVMGLKVTITLNHISKLLGMENIDSCALNMKDSSWESSRIKENIFFSYEDFSKVKNLKNEFIILFRISIGCLIPREGSIDQISWDHKHFIWFLVVNQYTINLPTYIFSHLCEAIRETNINHKKSIPHARLLSKLFHHTT